MGLIDSPDNGATEIPGTTNHSIVCSLIGPIRYWWAKGQWASTLHQQFTLYRDAVFDTLSEDFLVYAPHRAWRGPWDFRAQEVNDLAVSRSDVVVVMQVANVTAYGTEQEIRLAERLVIPIIYARMNPDMMDRSMQDIAKLRQRVFDIKGG